MNIKSISGLSLILMATVISSCLLSGCKTKQKEILQADPRFIPYISSYSAGTLSSGSSIRIKLTEPSPSFAGENKPVAEKLFDFSPSIEGEAIWIDKQTVAFRPATPMIQDQIYTAKFFLGKVRQVESQFKEFDFGFHIMKQSFEIMPEGLVTGNTARPDLYTFEGKLVTTDVLVPSKLNELLSAEYQGKKMEVSWNNDPGGHNFSFRINGIERNDNAGSLHLSWNGRAIGVDNSDQIEIPVPAVQFFGKLSDRVITGDENAILVYFSDPLDPVQDLRGFVTTNKDQIATYRIQANILKVIFTENFDDLITLKISPGLVNTVGKKLEQDFEISKPAGTFASLKPQVKAIGNGSILPSSQGLIFPFDAVNLKSVRLTIIKIFENNIAQFLQENTLAGNNEMKRVGRPVFSKIIPLTNSGVTDFSKWNRFTFDLNDFIKADPGAIYQINITFGKRNILFPCTKSSVDEADLTESEQMQKLNEKFEGPDGYYYYGFLTDSYEEEDYNWKERDNPCNPAYYTYDKMITRNILATDIGLILKKGNSGDAVVAVTDIRTAVPMANVVLEVLDYQLQKIYETKSNSDGFATFRLDRKPFLLIARYGLQRSYLRVDDGSSLSLSNFDVSGNEVQKGLKGFIYGERGVWRPGDSLFLSFILQDKQEVLPVGHPIVFELKNPSGQLITRQVKPNDKKGMFTFRTITAADAPTGKWTAIIKAGGTVFDKSIRIETVKPNRLKINFQYNNTIPFGKSGRIEAKLHAQWLHGGTSGNLKVRYEVLLTKAKTEFESFKNYSFDDPGVLFTSETLPVFDGRLDAAGNAVISNNLKLTKTLPSTLNGYFRGKVFEPSGDFSVDFLTEPIFPFESYAGIRVEEPKSGRWLEADMDHTVYLASVNKKGKPVSLNNLKVDIFKLDWSWWWQEEDNGAAEYVVYNYRNPVTALSASTSAGKGSFKFRINYPDWGRYYIRVSNPSTGQSCGQYVYIDWPDSYGRRDSNVPGGATMLALSSDRNKCKVNETVRVTIPGMPGARALISLETGSKVLKAYWIDAGKTENVEQIKADNEMTPNIFIHVTVLQPHKDKKNDLPIRQYGVLSLDVEDPKTLLSPIIRMPDQLKPEKKVSLSVSEKNSKAMTYTIAVVDEGLLDLTHFKTPDPHQAFFAHEALGVKTFDLFDDVIGAYGGTLERLLSIGGDEILKQEEKGKSLRFKPVVKFFGPFSLAAGKTASHSFIMPNYIGSVRTMVIAASEDSYGFAEKTVPVKQDIMVMATLPRIIRPNEEIVMPVNVFVMNKAVKSVTVTVRTNKMISLSGPATRTVTFQGEEDKIVYFRLKCGNLQGNGKVDVIASGNGDKSNYSVDIPVLFASLPIHKTTEYIIQGGQKKSLEVSPFGFPGTNSAGLDLSQVEKVNFSERIKYLVRYPYGCAEQTISGAFAQLYLPKVVGMDNEMISHTEYNIREGINRLAKLQGTDGGFLYWPSSRTIDDWVTSYAGHFLLESIKAGYSVPDYMISKWKEYQKFASKKWVPDPKNRSFQLIQAYRLYTLALAGSPDFASMNRLREEKELLPQASWRLAAAYALAGKRDIALKMTASLPIQLNESYDQTMTYGSVIRDWAMMLETMTELNKAKSAAVQAKKLSAIINGNEWLSTQECAYAFLSLAKYYTRFASPQPIAASVILNGNEVILESRKFSLNQPLKIIETRSNSLIVNNKSNLPLFITLTETGIPVKDDEIAFRNDLRMSVSYISREGKPLDVTNLRQGTEFKVIVKVRSTDVVYGCKNLALRQIFPSGWEIDNNRIAEAEPSMGQVPFSYQDFRDDRIYTFFDLLGGKEKTFVFSLTAAYAGRYYFPGAWCEAMYESGVGAKDKGLWVKVVPE